MNETELVRRFLENIAAGVITIICIVLFVGAFCCLLSRIGGKDRHDK